MKLLPFTATSGTAAPRRCTVLFHVEQLGAAVKLSITHSIEREPSKFIDAVSGGWPKILSNLKSLLETGQVTMETKA